MICLCFFCCVNPRQLNNRPYSIAHSHCDKPWFGLGLGCSGTCKYKPSDDTESHIRKWRDSVNAVEIEDIDGACLGVAYEVGLYSFTNHGSHFFIAATISSEIMIDSEQNCPTAIVFASLDSKKVSYLVQNQVLLNGFNVHILDKKTLDEVLIAENQVPAIDGSNYDLTKNSCAHYAQSIWRALKIEETAELADFLITNLLRDDGLARYAKQTLSQGGLRVLTNYGKDSALFTKYVKDTVVSQLEIANLNGVEEQHDMLDFEGSMLMSLNYNTNPDLIPPIDNREDMMLDEMREQCPTQYQAAGECYHFNTNKGMECLNCAWAHLFENGDLSCLNMESEALASFSACADMCDAACVNEMNNLAICGVEMKCHGVTAIA